MPEAKGWAGNRRRRPTRTHALRVELDRRGEMLVGVSTWTRFGAILHADSCTALAEYAEQLAKLSRITSNAVVDLAVTCGDERGTFERFLAAQCGKRVLDLGLAGRYPVPDLVRALGVYACLRLGDPLASCRCLAEWSGGAEHAEILAAVPELR